jgi:hypothetical protein
VVGGLLAPISPIFLSTLLFNKLSTRTVTGFNMGSSRSDLGVWGGGKRGALRDGIPRTPLELFIDDYCSQFDSY